jgi:hypothetical protein
VVTYQRLQHQSWHSNVVETGKQQMERQEKNGQLQPHDARLAGDEEEDDWCHQSDSVRRECKSRSKSSSKGDQPTRVAASVAARVATTLAARLALEDQTSANHVLQTLTWTIRIMLNLNPSHSARVAVRVAARVNNLQE